MALDNPGPRPWDCCYELSSACIKKTFNLPLTLNENTATVTRITDITSAEALEGDAVVLLDSENLRILDSVGTRGMTIVPVANLTPSPESI